MIDHQVAELDAAKTAIMDVLDERTTIFSWELWQLLQQFDYDIVSRAIVDLNYEGQLTIRYGFIERKTNMSPDIPPSSVSHDTIQKGLWTGNFFTGKPVWVGVQELPISLKGLTDEELQEVYAVALTLHEAVINEDYDRNEKS